jgi:hypothetical protein
VIELDRAAARSSSRSRRRARTDVIVLAGKGHETIRKRTASASPFPTPATVADALARRRGRMMDTAIAASAVGGSVVGAAVHFSRVTTDTRAFAPAICSSR